MSEQIQMIKHIKARNFAEALKVHEEWAEQTVDCVLGLCNVEKAVGKQLYEEYDEYCIDNM